VSSCCGGSGDGSGPESTPKPDWLLRIAGGVALGAALWHWLSLPTATPALARFLHGCADLLGMMWWGLLIGVVFMGLLAQVPKSLVTSALGTDRGVRGILRATAAGVLLDLCSHGILFVGMQLYRRGASLGQTCAFLIASPWNSLSLTLILIALIGLWWTLAFIALSALIGVVAGLWLDAMVRRGVLPGNPYREDLPDGFRWRDEAARHWRGAKLDRAFWTKAARAAIRDSRMILRWIFLGVVLAAAIRSFVDVEVFQRYFGPTMLGLSLTLVATTLIEVCSEGSSPIAADLMTRAGAPGNAFTFLMAGVATDYTEVMALRETTRSWKCALFLPLATVPQVVLIGWLLNSLAGC